MTRRLAALALAITIAAPAAAWGSTDARRHQSTPAPGHAGTPAPKHDGTEAPMLVMPFEAPADAPQWHWMSEGVAVLLTMVLEAFDVPVVSREERVRAFERLQLPPNALVTHATMIKVGQLVDAGVVVTGHFETAGDRLAIGARVFDLVDGGLRPELRVNGAVADVFVVAERLARALAAVDPAATPARGVLPPSPSAFEQFVKGVMADTPAVQVAHLEQAVRTGVEFDAARLALWEVHTADGRHAQALDAVAPIGLFGAAGREARFRAALSRLHLGRLDDAFAGFESLAADTRAAAAYNALGIVQLRRAARTPAPAVYYFQQAAEADPSESSYRFNLGYAYWGAGDAAAAVHWLREAVRLDPGDADAHAVLADALAAIGAGAEAARERELAARLSEEYERGGAVVASGLERVVGHLGPGPSRVETALRQATERDQTSLAAFHREAGRRAADRGDDRAAIQELRRALYLLPYDAEAHLLLGRIYLRGGRVAEAIDTLQIAVWSHETADAHLALAEAFLIRKDTAAAAEALDRARAMDPEHPGLGPLQARVDEARPPG